jgi:hypothetical protein
VGLLSVFGLASSAKLAESEGTLAVDSAVVGKLSHIHWSLPNYSGPALLTLSITHLEKEKRVLLLTRIPTQGKFEFDFQFTDGAKHRIVALAEIEGKEPVRQETIIPVSAVEPPQGAVFPALLFFLGIFAAGMVSGHVSRNRRRRRGQSRYDIGQRFTRTPAAILPQKSMKGCQHE